MARQRGPIGGGASGGSLLDVLVVRLDFDLSGFRRGLAEAISGINSLKAAVAAQVGGTSLGDAMSAALIAPVVVATARLGQMRNEVRLLTSEMRQAAALTHGGAAVGASLGAIVPYRGGGPVVDATPRTGADGRPIVGRGSNGRFVRSYGVESDDLRDATDGVFVAPGGGGGERRRRGMFGRMFDRERQRTNDAFESGRNTFPGYDDASDNLGAGAHRVGSGMRRSAGGRLASALGLVGVGALFGDLIALASSLATVVGGTLAGAFSALATPLGLVVALLAAIAAAFVAANWDSFKEFGEWFGTRARELFSEGIGDIISGWGNFGQACMELWNLIKTAFRDDSGSLTNTLQFFGEVALRVINAVMEILGGLGNVAAELVRTLTALFQGDLAGVFEHLGAAIMAALHTISEAFLSLFPEIRSSWDGFWGWMEERARQAGSVIQQWMNPRNGGQLGGGRGDGTVRGGAMGDDLSDGKGSSFGKAMANVTRDAVKQVGESAREAVGDEARALAQDDRLGALGGAFVNRGTEAIVGAAAGAGFSIRQVLSDIVFDLRDRALQGLGNIVQSMLTEMWSGAAGTKGGGIGGWLSGMLGGGGGGKGGKGGGGGFASFIGSLFAGGFDKGGFIPPGQWGIVGERRPEVVFGGRAGASVFANDNSAGGGGYIDQRVFNFTGTMAERAEFESMIRRLDASVEARALGAYGEARRRGRL